MSDTWHVLSANEENTLDQHKLSFKIVSAGSA